MANLIKSQKQINLIRQSGRILSSTLKALKEKADVGVNLMELEELAREKIVEAGAKPAFLGYKPSGAAKPFPAALCASVNDVIVHGVPHDYVLQNGDLLSLDLGVDFKGGISDAAVTLPIGKVKDEDEFLINVTKKALEAGIAQIKPGNTTGDIGHAIENVAIENGARVMDGLTGHGVGEEVHEEPSIYNFGEPGDGIVLKSGMVLALEPMFSMKENRIAQLTDDSYATADGSNAAHFEHTILVTDKGSDILTA